MITVKVARMGSTVETVALEDGATVQQALDAASLSVDREEIRVNSTAATTENVLRTDDIVTLVPKVKGGQKIVKVARLGSRVIDVAVGNEATVAEALEAAEVVVENEEVRLDGRSADLSDKVGSALMITIVPKVKGGK